MGTLHIKTAIVVWLNFISSVFDHVLHGGFFFDGELFGSLKGTSASTIDLNLACTLLECSVYKKDCDIASTGNCRGYKGTMWTSLNIESVVWCDLDAMIRYGVHLLRWHFRQDFFVAAHRASSTIHFLRVTMPRAGLEPHPRRFLNSPHPDPWPDITRPGARSHSKTRLKTTIVKFIIILNIRNLPSLTPANHRWKYQNLVHLKI